MSMRYKALLLDARLRVQRRFLVSQVHFLLADKSRTGLPGSSRVSSGLLWRHSDPYGAAHEHGEPIE